jgi:hypothetical protein
MNTYLLFRNSGQSLPKICIFPKNQKIFFLEIEKKKFTCKIGFFSNTVIFKPFHFLFIFNFHFPFLTFHFPFFTFHFQPDQFHSTNTIALLHLDYNLCMINIALIKTFYFKFTPLPNQNKIQFYVSKKKHNLSTFK